MKARPLIYSAFIPDDGTQEWATTINMLKQLMWETARENVEPHLSAHRLAALVRRCDCIGPMRLRGRYDQQLDYETGQLVPRAISGNDLPEWQRAIKRWHLNCGYWQCMTIGPVLEIQKILLEKWWMKNER